MQIINFSLVKNEFGTMMLLTVQEVASMLKLSVLTIYKYIKEQKLEAVSFGGHYRIPEAALDTFIQSHLVVGSTSSSTEKNLRNTNDKTVNNVIEKMNK